jgi:hypothetical protein
MHINIHLYIISFLALHLGSYKAFSQNKEMGDNFGVKLGLGYTLLGATYSNYNGVVMPNFSLFYSKTISRSIDLVADLGYTGTRVKQRASEARYNANYLDAGLISYLYPSRDSRDFAFTLGVKSHYLMNFSSQKFSMGNYLRVTDARNQNQEGTISGVAVIGLSVAFSPVISVELNYQPSIDNKNTSTTIQGRPPIFETAIRINASGIRNQYNTRNAKIRSIATQMKKGAALVMLTTPNNAEMQNLINAGRTEEVEWIKNELKVRNFKIMEAFNNRFSFSTVYFFYDTNAYKVISGNTQGIFVDPTLNTNATIKLQDSISYYVLSFCEDISGYTDKSQFGLYVYDGALTQLPRPFNSPSQLISPMLEGDPLNYLKKRRYTFSLLPFEKYVSRLDSKLYRLMILEE